jgi:hypothetical protein
MKETLKKTTCMWTNKHYNYELNIESGSKTTKSSMGRLKVAKWEKKSENDTVK